MPLTKTEARRFLDAVVEGQGGILRLPTKHDMKAARDVLHIYAEVAAGRMGAKEGAEWIARAVAPRRHWGPMVVLALYLMAAVVAILVGVLLRSA